MSSKRYITLPLLFFALSFHREPLTAATPYSMTQAMKEQLNLPTAQEYFARAMEAYQKQNWVALRSNCRLFFQEYKDSPFASDLRYYLGVAHFHLNDFDMANVNFSKYLEDYTSPKYFEEAVQYKFSVAQKFEEGYRKHLFGKEKLPSFAPSREAAVEIYNEIITTLPRHDIAAQSLYKKGKILAEDGDFQDSIDSYQTLIRCFPKHPFASESYLEIAKVYLKQSDSKQLDPDILDLAQINLRRFYYDFPSEKRLSEAQELLSKMRDRFAEDLWATGAYYEKRKISEAAILYYRKLLRKYPDSLFAAKAKQRIEELRPKFGHLTHLFPDAKEIAR